MKFQWNAGDKEDFSFFPATGHLKPNGTKTIKVSFKAAGSVQYD